MDFETMLGWLAATRDLLWSQYKYATDKQDISDSYDRWLAQDDAIDLLMEQKEEIEELNKKLEIMYNRCISYRGADDCGDCVQKEKCESTRKMWHGWHLKNRERVRDGEQG